MLTWARVSWRVLGPYGGPHPAPAPAPAPGDQGVLERCYHGTGCVGDRRPGGSGAEHNIAAWSQLTSPGSLHPCLHEFLSTSPLCPASAVSTVQPSAISSELCGHWQCARQQARRRGVLRSVLDRGWRGADLLHRRTLCTTPGLETLVPAAA